MSSKLQRHVQVKRFSTQSSDWGDSLSTLAISKCFTTDIFLQILFCGKYEDWAATTNTYAEIQLVTLTFDLAFRWAKVRSKYRLKSKSKVVSLSQSLRPNFALSERLSQKLKWLSANTSHVPLLLHHSKRTRVHLSSQAYTDSLCELYSRVPHVRLHR